MSGEGQGGGQQARRASPPLSGMGRTVFHFKGTLLSRPLECRPAQVAADEGPRLPRPPPVLRSMRWLEQGTWPPQDQQAAATHIGVPISKDLVEDMAELPAEDGAAGKWQTDGIGPESKGPFLVMSAQNDAY